MEIKTNKGHMSIESKDDLVLFLEEHGEALNPNEKILTFKHIEDSNEFMDIMFTGSAINISISDIENTMSINDMYGDLDISFDKNKITINEIDICMNEVDIIQKDDGSLSVEILDNEYLVDIKYI